MLTDVQAVQMKSEGAHLAQQRIDEQLHKSLSAIRQQALAHQFEVAQKFIRRCISRAPSSKTRGCDECARPSTPQSVGRPRPR